MNIEKNYCNTQPNTSPINIENLEFISCVFFSDKQFNEEKIHKPKYSLCIEKSINGSFLINIENEINNIIDDIYNKLNENNTLGIPIKIPAPIYILLGRELEYNNNILESERFIHNPTFGISKLGNADITPDENGTLAIIDYLNSFFNNSGLATTEDIKKYDKSHLNIYKFKGNIKILLYVPYMTNEYRYITNFQDIYSSSTFFYNLIMSDVFLKFERTSNIDKEFIKNLKKMNFNNEFISLIIKVLREASKNKFLLYDDLINLCFEGGCVSPIGEDLKVLIPKYDSDEATNSENAIKFSPFLPNKCLSKTNNFLCNVKYAKDTNKSMDEFVKEYAMGDIINGLNIYSTINDMVNKKMIEQENVNKIDKYKSPLNLIISIINNHIKDGYSDDLNKGDREITIKENNEDKKIKVKYNYYSREYSENIIKELSLLNENYPGIPEIVMSFYIYNDNLKTDKIIYMPWGNQLFAPDYIYNIYTPLEVNNDIYSLNNKYGLRLNRRGLVFIYNIETSKVIYFINNIKLINTAVSLIYDKNEFIIQIIDENNNQRAAIIEKNIPKLIENCDECKDPITMIIDNDGRLRFYGNSFYEITSKEFNNYINNQIKLVGNFNINELENDDIIQKLDELNEKNSKNKENYQYCSDINGSCIK